MFQIGQGTGLFERDDLTITLLTIMCDNAIGHIPTLARLEVIHIPMKRLDLDADYLITHYMAGQSARQLAAPLGVSKAVVLRILRDHGVTIRVPLQQRAAAFDVTGAYQAYQQGLTITAIARQFRASADLVTKCFARAGYIRRSGTEARTLMNAQLTPEQRRAKVSAAHAATRGRQRTNAELAKSALGRETNGQFDSPDEAQLWQWLDWHGEVATPQRAFGRYSIDLALPPVAIEIASTERLAYGGSGERNVRKIRALLAGGWHVVVIWTGLAGGKLREPLRIEAAEYLIAFLQIARINPTMPREYRVILGSGQEIAVSRGHFNQLTFKPPPKSSLWI